MTNNNTSTRKIQPHHKLEEQLSKLDLTNTYRCLPSKVLKIIGKHLESRIDVYRFRAVSTTWRSAVSPSYRQCQSSLTLPQPIGFVALVSPITICRLEHKTRNVACMVKVVESASGELQIMSPFSSNNITVLMKIRTLDLLDFRLIELARGYRLLFTDTPSTYNIKKVVLFDNCGIIALFDTGMLGYLGFEDKVWTNLGNEGYYYDDIMVCKNLFYVIDSLGIISWINKSMKLIQYSPPLCGLGHTKILVESDGQFYVIDWYLRDEKGGKEPYHTVDMKVYKLDEEWCTWVDVKSLENRVFVLTKEVCFSVSVKDSSKGNCVYFVDGVMGRVDGVSGRVCVYRFDDGCISWVGAFPTPQELLMAILPSMDWPLSEPYPRGSC